MEQLRLNIYLFILKTNFQSFFSTFKPDFHMITTTLRSMKKSSAIAAMIWKPLSSDGSDHSDCSDNDRWDRLQFYLSDCGDRSDHNYMEASLQRSHSASQRPQIKSTGMHCVRSRLSKWLPTQTLSNRHGTFYGRSTKIRLSVHQSFEGI